MTQIEASADSAYQEFLGDFKTQIRQSRIEAARVVNTALVRLYWALGKLIIERQEALGWGKGVVERVSADLRAEFPSIKGFSPRNLWDIKRFYEAYVDAPEFLRQAAAEIPWGHNILVLQKVMDLDARRYYIETAARLGWTRNVLLNQIKGGAYEISLQGDILPTPNQRLGSGLPQRLPASARTLSERFRG